MKRDGVAFYISRATLGISNNAERMRTSIRSFHISRTSREIWHWRACCRHVLEFVTIRHVFMPRTLHKTHWTFLNVLVIKPTFNISSARIYKWSRKYDISISSMKRLSSYFHACEKVYKIILCISCTKIIPSIEANIHETRRESE